MREWCGCGAGIHANARQVARWRTEHKHEHPVEEEREPDKNGSEAITERSPQVDYDDGPFFAARIGFQPNRNPTMG